MEDYTAKVYIVMMRYEGIIGDVFSTREKAQGYIDEFVKNNSGDEYSRDVWYITEQTVK